MIEEECIQQNSADVGTYFILELEKLRQEFEVVGDVRGKGLMIGLELVKDKVSQRSKRSQWIPLHHFTLI